MVSKQPDCLMTLRSAVTDREQPVAVRSALLNRNSPRRRRHQQVRFKDLEDEGGVAPGVRTRTERCRLGAGPGSPHPNRKREGSAVETMAANGGSVVGAVRGEMTAALDAVVASLARAPPHPLTPGPTRRALAPPPAPPPRQTTPSAKPISITLSLPRPPCLSAAIQTSPSLQRPLPLALSATRTRSHSLEDMLGGPEGGSANPLPWQAIAPPCGHTFSSPSHKRAEHLPRGRRTPPTPPPRTDSVSRPMVSTATASEDPSISMAMHSDSTTQSRRQRLGRTLSDPGDTPTCTAPPIAVACEGREESDHRPMPLPPLPPPPPPYRAPMESTSSTHLKNTPPMPHPQNTQSMPRPQNTPPMSCPQNTQSMPRPQNTPPMSRPQNTQSMPWPQNTPPMSRPQNTQSMPWPQNTPPMSRPQNTQSMPRPQNTPPMSRPQNTQSMPRPQNTPPMSRPQNTQSMPRPQNTPPMSRSQNTQSMQRPQNTPPMSRPQNTQSMPRPQNTPPMPHLQYTQSMPRLQNTPPTPRRVTVICGGSEREKEKRGAINTQISHPTPNHYPIHNPTPIPVDNFTPNHYPAHNPTPIPHPVPKALPAPISAPNPAFSPTQHRTDDSHSTDQAQTLKQVQKLLGALVAGAPGGEQELACAKERLLGPHGPLGEVRGLRARLQSLEGLLETSHSTIRLLLELIQELEHKEVGPQQTGPQQAGPQRAGPQRAGPQRKPSYVTGQKIKDQNAPTDSTCVIYSVENDFRLQEGSFTQSWMKDDVQTSDQGSSQATPLTQRKLHPHESTLPAQPPNVPRPPNSAKKGKRKCFWFL